MSDSSFPLTRRTLSQPGPPPVPAAILLAAGGSRRLGQPKQLVRHEGQTLVQRAAAALVHAGFHPVIVVTGAQTEAVSAELAAISVQVLHNSQWSTGLASSIRAGLRALPAAQAVLLTLCDQPFVTASHLRSLLYLFRTTNPPAAASRYGDFGGPPAIFSRSLFDDLYALQGDEGAKGILRRLAKQVAWLDLPEAATDIDTPDDLAKL